MQISDISMLKKLSFPDIDVEGMDLLLHQKILKIYVDGGFLDIDDGIALPTGIITFKDWKTLSIQKYDSETDQWTPISDLSSETLGDLSEVSFDDSSTSLCGFSIESGYWIEWKIDQAKISAEFE